MSYKQRLLTPLRLLPLTYDRELYNNYSMSLSWISSDKITNERVARVGYNHFISNKGEWNNCFTKFSNRFLPPIFISTILQSVRKENLAHYFPYDVKLRLLAHSRSFLANQKARNAIVGPESLLNIHNDETNKVDNLRGIKIVFSTPKSLCFCNNVIAVLKHVCSLCLCVETSRLFGIPKLENFLNSKANLESKSSRAKRNVIRERDFSEGKFA